MKTVIISARAKTINTLLKEAQKGGLILRSSDGHEFILAEIDDFNREIELTRQNQELMKLLDERGKQTKTFKAAEVKRQLGLEQSSGLPFVEFDEYDIGGCSLDPNDFTSK